MDEPKYLNPFTDTGFKRIFGQKDYKDVLIDFLNDVFADEPDFSQIVDIDYQDKEKIKDEKRKPTIIYDILCICQSGRRFIVEMQQRKHPNFDKRAVYYVSDGVCEQANTGSDWNYTLLPVYGVFISDFILKNLDPVVKASVSLRNDISGKLFFKRNTLYIHSASLFSTKKRMNAQRVLTNGFTSLKTWRLWMLCPSYLKKRSLRSSRNSATYSR